jgi:hypothetical protein
MGAYCFSVVKVKRWRRRASEKGTSVAAAFHPVSDRGSFAFPERLYYVNYVDRWIVRLDGVGWEDASHELDLQTLATPQRAALPGGGLPVLGLPGVRWRQRSTRLGRADAGWAATHAPIYRPREEWTALAVSMEAAREAAMEMQTAQAVTVVVSLVALAEQAPCAPEEVVSSALADSEARLAAAALSLEAGVLRGSSLAVSCRLAAPAANQV